MTLCLACNVDIVSYLTRSITFLTEPWLAQVHIPICLTQTWFTLSLGSNPKLFKAIVFSQDDFASKGTFGSVWRHVGCHNWWEDATGWKTRDAAKNMLQCTGYPFTTIIQYKVPIVPKLRNADLKGIPSLLRGGIICDPILINEIWEKVF